MGHSDDEAEGDYDFLLELADAAEPVQFGRSAEEVELESFEKRAQEEAGEARRKQHAASQQQASRGLQGPGPSSSARPAPSAAPSQAQLLPRGVIGLGGGSRYHLCPCMTRCR